MAQIASATVHDPVASARGTVRAPPRAAPAHHRGGPEAGGGADALRQLLAHDARERARRRARCRRRRGTPRPCSTPGTVAASRMLRATVSSSEGEGDRVPAADPLSDPRHHQGERAHAHDRDRRQRADGGAGPPRGRLDVGRDGRDARQRDAQVQGDQREGSEHQPARTEAGHGGHRPIVLPYADRVAEEGSLGRGRSLASPQFAGDDGSAAPHGPPDARVRGRLIARRPERCARSDCSPASWPSSTSSTRRAATRTATWPSCRW